MDKYKKSIEIFVSELKKRIDLLSESSKYSPINPEEFNTFLTIIKKYTNKSPEELIFADLLQFPKTDLIKILLITGLDNNSANQIISSIESNQLTILNTLEAYYKDYIQIEKTQSEMQNSKVAEYQHFIDILDDNYSEVFTEFATIDNLMSLFAIDKSERWQILEYLALKNLNIQKQEINDLNFNKKITNIINKYLRNDNETLNKVKECADQIEIDIDSLPTVAKNIALKLNLNERIVQDYLCALILNTLYLKRENIESNHNEIKEMMEKVISFMAPISNEVVTIAKKIVSDNKELYEKNIQENNGEVKKYIDSSILEMVDEGMALDTAINLKSLPIIKTIIESLDKLENLDIYSEDYALCCDILSELVEAYQSLEEKRTKYIKRIK